MFINEIEEKVLKGELILEKTYLGKRHKNKYIWNNETDKILEVKRIEFDGWSHRVVYKDNQSSGYRINKKVYNELLKKIAS